jgi:hypothetical protein
VLGAALGSMAGWQLADPIIGLAISAAILVLEDARQQLLHSVPRLGDILLHANPAGCPDAHGRTWHHRPASTRPIASA